MPSYRLGDRAPAVTQVCGWLTELGFLPTPNAPAVPGDERPEQLFTLAVDVAVRAFQQQRGLVVDGIVGTETFRALEGARWRLGDRILSQQVGHPLSGDDVLALQHRLTDLGFDVGRCDATFGPRTATALRDFQQNCGLNPDSILGPATRRQLHQLSRSVTGGRSHELRESEAMRRRGPSLAGRRVVIDPGHGGADPGVIGFGLTERDVCRDLAARLEGRLAAAGVSAWLTHGPDGNPSDAERATFANETGADLLLSLHCDGVGSPGPNGISTYYFGVDAAHGSLPGERIAGLAQRELVARTRFTDARSHAKTWELLRLTRMPAVRIEFGYLSNPDDARRLADPDVRDVMAESLLAGVQRVFLPEHLDPPTGVLSLTELRAYA